MATSVVPALIDALVAASRTNLPNLMVLDGFGVTDDPGNYLMIGADDPDRADAPRAATSTQDWAHTNYTARDEEGDINCIALSWTGDTDQKISRDAVYATTAALENMLRANPSLGVPGLLWTSYGSASDLSQPQAAEGSASFLIFQVHFRARI